MKTERARGNGERNENEEFPSVATREGGKDADVLRPSEAEIAESKKECAEKTALPRWFNG